MHRSTRLASFLVTGLVLVAAPAQHGTPPGGTTPRLDGSTAESLRESIERARERLTPPERKRFDASLELMRRIFPEERNRRKNLHGAPTGQLLTFAEQMRDQFDEDSDGVVSDAELAVVHEQIQRAKRNANEAAAVATLKNCSSAQSQTQYRGVIDTNGNGTGEYAYFGEMTGTVGVRGEDGKTTDAHMSPPVLTNQFQVEGGIVERSGYCFRIYLPAADGAAVPEADDGGVGTTAPDPTNAEVLWCLYAWPAEYGVTGQRAFFISQAGDVFATSNKIQRYSGRDNPPSPYAIFPRGTRTMIEMVPYDTDPEERDTPHNDKAEWVVAN